MNETVRAYDLDAAAYVANGPVVPDSVRADIEEFVGLIGPGARVLEIGSGGGRDARLMEKLGLRVRRTDITPGFVSLLRISLKEGDGEGWSTHGSISNPRHFTYWQADELLAVVDAAGWGRVSVRSGIAGTRGETWLELSAVRDEVSP